MRSIRVLLVAADSRRRDAELTVLRGMHGVELVGAATGGPEGLRKATRRKADLVLMDLLNPKKMSGLEFAATVKRKPGAPRVVLLSLGDDPTYARAASEFRADGVLRRERLASGLPPLLRKLFPDRG